MYAVTKHLKLFVQGTDLLREHPTALLNESTRFVEKDESTSCSRLVGVKLNF